ncbi:RING-H2 finger protein ATL66-like [Musa acuminata AAA Group]|uniref:RING-H2 finger protein ATL66-like n=1 Tax=Musa acuminata AAA Group TaxID=214697 RepID=UPI0031CF6A22
MATIPSSFSILLCIILLCLYVRKMGVSLPPFGSRYGLIEHVTFCDFASGIWPRSADQRYLPGALAPSVRDRRGEEAQCPICLSNLRDGDKVKVLPSCVDMGFVCECVDAWSRAHTSCPLCRAGWLWLEGKNN